MDTTQTASQNLLRRLALMQHLGEDYFITVDCKAYEGKESEAKEQFNEDMEASTDYQENPIEFEEWCNDHLTEVEELDPEDYNNDYLVLTDSEADEKWEESLGSYLDDCVYPELPEMARNYFDDDKWKQDAKMDGRGHSLSSYDGNENEETVQGETFYIYRIN